MTSLPESLTLVLEIACLQKSATSMNLTLLKNTQSSPPFWMMKQVYFYEFVFVYNVQSLKKVNIWRTFEQLELNFFILDDAIRKSALPWTHGQSFVSSMKHFDDWDFSGRDDDDDVFLSPNQTEPDPTTEKRYNTTGKKYTEKGQTKGMLLRSQN